MKYKVYASYILDNGKEVFGEKQGEGVNLVQAKKIRSTIRKTLKDINARDVHFTIVNNETGKAYF